MRSLMLLWMEHGKKRGHTSLFGIVVIAWKTGQVLAWEVLSKVCMACKLREDMDLEEYKEWHEGHKEGRV